jgi:hypothetical protein
MPILHQNYAEDRLREQCFQPNRHNAA